MTGTGYHRELVTNIEVEGVRVFPDNRVLLIENVTPDIYVDIDQVRNIIILLDVLLDSKWCNILDSIR